MFGRRFQKGLDCDGARARRRSKHTSLRRKERDETLKKRARTHNSNEEEKTVAVLSHLSRYAADILKVDDLEANLHGLMCVRLLLSVERDPPTQAVRKTGVIPKVIQNLYKHSDADSEVRNQCKLEAAWILTNLAACNAEYVVYLINCKVIPALIDLLRNAPTSEHAVQAVWTFGNIASDGIHINDGLFQNGVVTDMVSILQDSGNLTADLLEHTLWAMTNLLRYTRSRRVKEVRGIVDVTLKLARETKREATVHQCLWCLVHLSNMSDSIVEYMCTRGVVEYCMSLMHHEFGKYRVALAQMSAVSGDIAATTQIGAQRKPDPSAPLGRMDPKIYQPCLRVIGGVLSGSDQLTQSVLDQGYLEIIEPFVSHWSPVQRKEAMWSLSNIMAGEHQQIETVLSRPTLMRAIMKAALNDSLPVRREACWCICNSVQECIAEQKKRLAEFGAIKALCSMLAPSCTLTETHLRIVIEALDCFLSMHGVRGSYNPYADEVQECRGLDYMEDRMSDENLNEEVFEMMVAIVKKFWGAEEDDIAIEHEAGEAENISTTVDTSTNQFKFGTTSFQAIAGNENDSTIINNEPYQSQRFVF